MRCALQEVLSVSFFLRDSIVSRRRPVDHRRSEISGVPGQLLHVRKGPLLAFAPAVPIQRGCDVQWRGRAVRLGRVLGPIEFAGSAG